jgi:hypothetical protein
MIDRDRIAHPKLVQLYDYWLSKRRGRRYPAHADLSRTEMRFILGNVDLIEITYDPIVFTFRLSGSIIDKDEGFDMQGKRIDDYPMPERREHLKRIYREVLETGEPHYEVSDRRAPDGVQRYYARLILPLSADGARIDMFLIGRIEVPAPQEA